MIYYHVLNFNEFVLGGPPVGSSVRPSVIPFPRLSERILESYLQIFLHFNTVLETLIQLCVTNFFARQIGKWTKNGPKTGFYKFIERFGHYFLLNSFYNKNLYYLLCSCTNPIFGVIFVPVIWAKIFSANQIPVFFNQPHLQNKSMKQLDFLHVDTNSHKLKVDQKILGRPRSKMDVASHRTLKLTVSQK